MNNFPHRPERVDELNPWKEFSQRYFALLKYTSNYHSAKSVIKETKNSAAMHALYKTA